MNSLVAYIADIEQKACRKRPLNVERPALRIRLQPVYRVHSEALPQIGGQPAASPHRCGQPVWKRILIVRDEGDAVFVGGNDGSGCRKARLYHRAPIDRDGVVENAEAGS